MSEIMNTQQITGIVGAGTMGSGIALTAAASGESVIVFDSLDTALQRSDVMIKSTLKQWVEKSKITSEQSDEIFKKVHFTSDLNDLSSCTLVIEAITEQIQIKSDLFKKLEDVVAAETILATNTSSLSITLLASGLKCPGRFLGLHFFNPAHIMPLVEVVSAIQTQTGIAESARRRVETWKKICVNAKDTPGFIVNKVARPYYSEALRIFEENLANIPTIDFVMTTVGGFKMGPFQLMDFIGHDVNFTVTETVWKSFFYDSRYRPSLAQQKLVEAGFLGKKSGRGFYDSQISASTYESQINHTKDLHIMIFNRIFAMLVNEAADTVYRTICSREDLELAVTKGVNYPNGLFEWGEVFGYGKIIDILDTLQERYREERYRVCPLLRDLAKV